MTHKTLTIYQLFLGIALFIFLLLSNKINTIFITYLLTNQWLFISTNTTYLIINLTFVLAFFLLENKKKANTLINLNENKSLLLSWGVFFAYSILLVFVLTSNLINFNKTTLLIILSLTLIIIFYPVFLTVRFFMNKVSYSKKNSFKSLLITYIILVFIVLIL